MIKINLLPKERKKFNFPAYVNDFFGGIFIIFILAAMVNAVLFYINTRKNFNVRHYERTWKEKEPHENALMALKTQLISLGQKSSTFKRSIVPDMPFSEQMYIIYKHLPVNLWFTEVRYEQDRVNILGKAIDMDTEATLAIKDFVSALMDTELAQYYDAGINIKALERSRVKEKSLVFFEVELLKKKDDRKPALVKK